MTRTFEIKTGTSDKKTSLECSRNPHAKLARLRAEYGLKVPLTSEQLGEDDNQAKRAWRINEHEAMQEALKERAAQPWSPDNHIPLTRDFRHIARREGINAGTQEDAEKFMSIVEKEYPDIYTDWIKFENMGKRETYPKARQKHPTGKTICSIRENMYKGTSAVKNGEDSIRKALDDIRKGMQGSSTQHDARPSTQPHDDFADISEKRKNELGWHAYRHAICDANSSQTKVSGSRELHFCRDYLSKKAFLDREDSNSAMKGYNRAIKGLQDEFYRGNSSYKDEE